MKCKWAANPDPAALCAMRATIKSPAVNRTVANTPRWMWMQCKQVNINTWADRAFIRENRFHNFTHSWNLGSGWATDTLVVTFLSQSSSALICGKFCFKMTKCFKMFVDIFYWQLKSSIKSDTNQNIQQLRWRRRPGEIIFLTYSMILTLHLDFTANSALKKYDLPLQIVETKIFYLFANLTWESFNFEKWHKTYDSTIRVTQ